MRQARVSFKTIGCRLNRAETAIMRAGFEAADYRVLPFGEPVDVSVIHGCVVTAQAQKKSLRSVRFARKLNPKSVVILAGCIAELPGSASLNHCPADFIVPQKDKFAIPALLSNRGLQNVTWDTKKVLPKFQTTRAFIKVQNGCDFKCSYCIVPYTRGRSTSRPLEIIIDEVNALADSGYREFTLTGANIGCYRDEGRRLVDLLAAIEKIDKVKRIRISSVELSTAEHSVIDYMAGSEKLCHNLHLPLQSGSDKILKAMGRRYTSSYFSDIIEYAVGKLGRFGLGTDIIAGFPGEDKKAFRETERMIADLPFNKLHVFGYSKRPGTPASMMASHVTAKEKKERVKTLIDLGNRKRRAFAETWIGSPVSVLIEKADLAKQFGTGWTGEYLPARIYGPNIRVNRIVRSVPERVENNVLVGTSEQ